MSRSEAQKQADKRYADKHKGQYVYWGTTFKPQELEGITAAIKASGMSKADFIRWAVKKLETEIPR